MAGEEQGKINIVLVHGVWMDASSWREVLPILGHKGYKVTGVQIPLTSFEEDVAAVKRVLARQEGPVVLVGHSYGGGVITAAGNDPKIKALVYIAAFAPEANQALGELLGMNPPAANVQMKPDADGLVWASADILQDAIAHDVHRGIVNLLAAVQKPYAAKLFEASVSEPAWKTKPSWYLITTEDRILNPKTQHAVAEKIGAKISEIGSSHLPLFSHPDAVAKIIEDAAQAI